MACDLKINSIIGIKGTNGSLEKIIVEGTTEICRQIRINIRCDGKGKGIHQTVIAEDGSWEAVFEDVAQLKESVCECGALVTVEAICIENPECSDTKEEELICRDEPECPEITGITAEVSDECDDNDNREVTFSVSIAGTGVQSILWDYGDGNNSGLLNFLQNQTITHQYDASSPQDQTYNVEVHISGPNDCLHSFTKKITVPSCNREGDDCPIVDQINADIAADLNPDGSRDVTFSVDISGTGTQWIIWDFGDGNTSGPINANQNPNGSITHSYASSPQDQNPTVTVTILGPDDCEDSDSKEITIPGSEEQEECPTPTQIHADIDEICKAGKREVELSVDIDGNADSISWSFGDGNSTGPIIASQNPNGAVTHQYDAPGPESQINVYNVTVTIVSQNGTCVEIIEKDILVAGCDDTKCPKPSAIIEDISDSCSSDDERNVEFSVDIEGSDAQWIIWDFGDGNSTQPINATQNPDGSVSHQYDASDQDDKEYDVEVTILGPGSCQESKSKNITIPSCNGNGNGNGSDCPWWNPRCWSLCGALLSAAIAIIVGTGIAAIIAACTGVGTAAIVAIIATGAVGLILLGVWLALCGRRSCDILIKTLRFFTYLTLLSALLAIIFMFFAPPCSIGAFLASGYFGTVVSILYWAAIRFGCLEERGRSL